MNYKLHIDWDADDWKGTPDFSQDIDDCSDYLQEVRLSRGQEKEEEGASPAGTLTVRLNNSGHRFTWTDSSSALYGKIRIWLPVRLQADDGSSFVTIYRGFISRITLRPFRRRQYAIIRCTDGTDLLARNMVTEDKDNQTDGNDADAMNNLLNAAGWPADKRSIEDDTPDIMSNPHYREY